MDATQRLLLRATPEFLDRLAQCLGEMFELVPVGDSEDLRARLEDERPAAVLVDPKQMSPSDDDLIRAVRQVYPDVPVALIALTRSEECFAALQMYGLGAAIPAEASLAQRPMKVFFDHFIEPVPTFGLGPYFPSRRPAERRRIDNPAERADVVKDLVSEFQECSHVTSHDLQLVFEEILSNAIFHAFRTETNDPKYDERTDRALDAHDEIYVEWAIEEDLSAVAITDNQGLLAPREVWQRFQRQTSMKGLLDDRGRGLYLTHLLSRQELFTISPGLQTQAAVFFSPDPEETEKPISIRIVPKTAQGI